MTLTDTGPFVALINRNDPHHALCLAATKQLPAGPLVTTWPCFTEAMYLLFRAGGYAAQEKLWQWCSADRLVLHASTEPEMERMVELMGKYRDKPMDLVDASLIAAADHLSLRRVFTIDRDFYIYRLADGSALDLVS